MAGFISIDCGATSDYLDEGTGIFYKSDSGFVDTGTNNVISPEYYSSMVSPNYVRQIKNLRSFPQGTKNCYTLKPEQGKNSNYLIRASFFMGIMTTRINLQSLTYTLGLIFGPRYEDDVYDRLWLSRSTLLSNWVPINTSSVINTQDSNDSYQLPEQVLRTAVQPPSGHNALTSMQLSTIV
uniref:Malectin-like domain-containing protein n=1 Tax=Quercus lobata TaxID=97700 RepID=A0A7N2N885_QUELO